MSTYDDDKYEQLAKDILYFSRNSLVVNLRFMDVSISRLKLISVKEVKRIYNRRYTCLRRIQRDNSEPVYFETVIMDMDIREDKKQIKLLELAIQHGEEKKVDYDLID